MSLLEGKRSQPRLNAMVIQARTRLNCVTKSVNMRHSSDDTDIPLDGEKLEMAAFHLGHSDVGNHVWEIQIAICHNGDTGRVQYDCTRVDGHVERWGWEQGMIWSAVGLYGWENGRSMVVCVSEGLGGPGTEEWAA